MLRRLLRLKRRPDDTFQAYNVRTAAIIRKWCSEARVTLIYIRVLKAVYKAAWKEIAFKLDCGEAPLAKARSYRSVMWWQTWRGVSSQAKRRKMGITHASQGKQLASYENPFVCLWDCCWREKRTSSKTIGQWMKNFPEFAVQMSELWKLPPPSFKCSGNDAEISFTVKLPTCKDDLPHLPHNLKEDGWESGGGRVWVQTDNQQLQQLFAGLSKLECESLRPPCVRVGRLLRSMLVGGFRLRRETSDLIEWHARSFNTYADFAASASTSDVIGGGKTIQQ